jgi:hypothetical protein
MHGARRWQLSSSASRAAASAVHLAKVAAEDGHNVKRTSARLGAAGQVAQQGERAPLHARRGAAAGRQQARQHAQGAALHERVPEPLLALAFPEQHV